MKLIIGIGNPGKKYKNNRHNVGYLVVDVLQKGKLPENVIVKKTNVLMNESGKTVKKLVGHYKIETPDLWVIHDDLDIALGDYKIQKGRGPRLHKGVLSIEKNLGTEDFWRVRVGVDNRSSDNRIPGETYVLQDFRKEELEKLTPVIDRIVEEIYDYLASSYKS